VKKTIKINKKTIGKLAIVGLFIIVAFAMGLNIPRTAEMIGDQELQQLIDNNVSYNIGYIKSKGLQYNMEFDIQITSYDRLENVIVSSLMSSVDAFVLLAIGKDTNVIFLSYNDWVVNVPVFWFVYYSEDYDMGVVVKWTPIM